MHTETDDLYQLLAILPPNVRDSARQLPSERLVELVLDLGRPPQARLTDGVRVLATAPVTRENLDTIVSRVGGFDADNRAGVEGTLHRIACLRNRAEAIIGLTLRIGRSVFGTIDTIRELVEGERSLLLLGRPGVGKTTRLREVARVLADEAGRRVIVVDTSNEIGGDGDIPHPAIGGARRLQVPHRQGQHAVMIEAVENHMPETVVVDEIGTAAEAQAARTIAERGVQLIATAHGTTLANLVANPTLADLVGGVEAVTLGDDESRARGTQKTVLERRGPPTFDSVVEIVAQDCLTVYADTARAVDALLRGHAAGGVRHGPGTAKGEEPPPRRGGPPAATGAAAPPRDAPGLDGQRPARIYAYAVRRDSVDRVIRDLRINATSVSRAERADLVVALRSRREDARLRRLIADNGAAVHSVKRNSTAQIRRVLQNLFRQIPGHADATVSDAAREAEAAVHRALDEGIAVELPPRPPSIRQLQHRIAMRHRLLAESAGSDAQKHLVIQPPGPG